MPDFKPDSPPHRSSQLTAQQPRDLLGIGPEVDAFAYLIALKSMTPPLAIGLFGAWGSGKSFFIRSLQQRIDRLLAEGKTAPPGTKLPFHRSVVQIEFNVWQYMQGNLWASLLDHLLRNLDGDALEADDLVGARQREYLTKMRTSKEALLNEQQRLRTLEEERQAAVTTLEEKRAARAVALVELERARRQNPVALAAVSQPVRRELSRLATRGGVPDVMATAEDVGQAVREIRATVTRGGGVVTTLRRAGWLYTASLIVVLVALPVLGGWLASTHSWSAVTQASALIASLLVVVLAALKGANRSLSKLVEDLERVEKDATKEINLAVQKAERDLAQKDEQVAQAQERERKLAGQTAELAAKLDAVTPGRVLNEFLAERLGSDDYRKYLGLPAIVRRDLDRLSRIIERENLTADDDARESDDSVTRQINRIVLYIDDLDRCPTDVVIQVLQAVHLLLAFPLFVVVVAVDSRWLAGSLEDFYKVQLGSRSGASADDYLEKIFQVPFLVSRLETEGRRQIVQGLLGPVAATSGSSGPAAGPEEPHVGASVLELAELLARMSDVDAGSAPWLEAARMQINVEELAFMNDLAPLLGDTPRSVKRFVNVYQLIKSIARARGSYTAADAQAVLFLLALATGQPADAQVVADAVEQAAAEELSENLTLQHAVCVDSDPLPQAGSSGPLTAWLMARPVWANKPVRDLGPWLPSVQRFSFAL